jgi:hypothetical protein
VGKPIRHLSGSRRAFLSDDLCLLILLPITHCSEVSIVMSRASSESNASVRPCAITRIVPRVSSVFKWKKDAICYERRLDTEDIEKLLRDCEVLWMSTLKTKSTCAMISWQNCIEESRVVPRHRDPMVELLSASAFFLDADPALSAPHRSTAALTNSCRMVSGFSSSARDSRCRPAICTPIFFV